MIKKIQNNNFNNSFLFLMCLFNRFYFMRIFFSLIIMLSIIINIYPEGMTMNKEKAILVVSFGTTHLDTLKNNIEVCENKIALNFKDFTIRRAFTSNIVRKILKEKKDIIIDSVEEALNKLSNERFEFVVVQPLHIIPGEEYNEKIIKLVNEFRNKFKKIVVAKSLLYGIKDYDRVINALKNQIPVLKKDQAVVLMGHGTYHPANACYSMLQLKLDEQIPNIYVGTVEGYPELKDVITKLKKNKIKKIILMPFMLVAGDHAMNDMSGDDDESWKNILKKEGFKVELYLKGLGENPSIQDIYVKQVEEAIESDNNTIQNLKDEE